MKTGFKDSFVRDLKVVSDQGLLGRVKEAIDAVEKASSPAKLTNLKKLKGRKNYFRLRIGDYASASCWKMTPLFLYVSLTAKTSTSIFLKVEFESTAFPKRRATFATSRAH